MAKKAKKVFNLTEYCKDVTLYEFANSSEPKTGRVKKSEINNVIHQVKKLSVEKIDQPWNKKLEYLAKDGKYKSGPKGTSYYRNGPKGTSYYRNGPKGTSYYRNAPRGTLKSKKDDMMKIGGSTYKRSGKYYRKYPIELWFKISEYIGPEDVGRFASICKDTLSVVLTARFWYNLYKRYYKEVPALPELLQPKCIVRKYGLRTNVIRALYYMYPPFVNKIKSNVGLAGNPRSLVKRVCILSWSEEINDRWRFYFKLKSSEVLNYVKKNVTDEKPGLLEMLEDICANVDYGCKVLEVISLNYVPLPMISGQRLNRVSVKVSHDFMHDRLELNFGCGTFPHIGSNDVILDSVLQIRVLDWWHPSFPRSSGLSLTSYSNKSNCFMDEIDLNID